MKARMVLGSALSLLLIAGVGYSQTQVTGGMRQGMMRSDSTVGMMRGGMSKGMMMGPGGQMGMMSGMRGKMMGMMGSGMGMMGGMMMEPLHNYVRTLAHSSGWMAKLDLSDQQKTKLVTLRADFLKRKADLQAELQKAKIDLDLLLGKNAPPAKVKQLLVGKVLLFQGSPSGRCVQNCSADSFSPDTSATQGLRREPQSRSMPELRRKTGGF